MAWGSVVRRRPGRDNGVGVCAESCPRGAIGRDPLSHAPALGAPATILGAFPQLDLLSLAAVDDAGVYLPRPDWSELASAK